MLAVLLSLTCLAGENSPELYPRDQPIIAPLWHRVADFSPALRSVEAGEISNDGRLAVSGSKFGYKVMLWRIADGHLLWEREHDSEVECVTFSPDGRTIASGGEDYVVRIWDTVSGEQLHVLEHPRGIDGIAWSNDGQLIAAGDEAGQLHLWNGTLFERLRTIATGSTINSLRFTKDDRAILVGGNVQSIDTSTKQRRYDGFARIVDVTTGQTRVEFGPFLASVKSVRFSPDEALVATGGFDNHARVFSATTGQLIHDFDEGVRIEAVAFSADGAFLTVGGHHDVIKFYRTSDFKLAYELPCPRVEYIDFSTDNRLMLTSHEDSGLLSLYMLVSDVQRTNAYHRLANEQLENRDLKERRENP